jgi:hypothetical protein
MNAQQKAFLNEIHNLSEQDIIRWERKGDELHATISLELSISDPLVDPLRSLVVDGGSTRQVYLPTSEHVLLDQFLQIEEFAERKGVGASANAAE